MCGRYTLYAANDLKGRYHLAALNFSFRYVFKGKGESRGYVSVEARLRPRNSCMIVVFIGGESLPLNGIPKLSLVCLFEYVQHLIEMSEVVLFR
jgi:hypothetical protein